MRELAETLLQHGYLILALLVFVDQIGLPLPSMPVLLVAGALAAAGRLNFGLALGLAVAAAFLSDILRYQIGRWWGNKALGLMCRISLEPDSCVRRTENVFSRYGARSLLVAKFFPGLNAAAPVLAGIFGMRPARFLLFDAAGALIWAAVFIALGYFFSNELEWLAAYFLRAGLSVGTVLVTGLAAYVIWKFVQRKRFLSRLQIARITPEELYRKLESGEAITVVDLRHALEFQADPLTVPGALRLPAEELPERHEEIPRDREVVLFCN